MSEFTVYSKANCVQCDATKSALDRLGAPYRSIDLDTDQDALAYVSADLGYRQAPVVVAPNGDHWAGFRPDLLKANAGA